MNSDYNIKFDMNVKPRKVSSKKITSGAGACARSTATASSLILSNTTEQLGDAATTTSTFGRNSVQYTSEEESVFQTMNTDATLESGVYILRKLENGKMEFVNVSKIDRDVFSSKEVGRTIKADSERLELFQRVGEEWSVTEKKVDLAIRGAQRDIFRFMELPYEIRCMIYGFAVVSPQGLRIKYVEAQGEAPNIGLGLLRTTKAIYAEAMPFIWKNNFHFYVLEPYLRFPETYNSLSMNVKELTYHCRRWVIDHDIFLRLADFPHLKILNIKLVESRPSRSNAWFNVPENVFDDPGMYYYDLVTPDIYKDPNLCDDPNIPNFRVMHGFGALVTIRGLEKVRVENIQMQYVTAKEVKDFEIFLNKQLTQAKGGVRKEPLQLPKIDRSAGH